MQLFSLLCLIQLYDQIAEPYSYRVYYKIAVCSRLSMSRITWRS